MALTFQALYDKVPNGIKDKFLIKKRDRAIEIVKQKIELENKKITEIDYDTLEDLIYKEESKLSNEQLKTILITVLTAEGLVHLIEM